eukprot:scaffold270_cov347-Pavlova_lutheri.AAC.11
MELRCNIDCGGGEREKRTTVTTIATTRTSASAHQCHHHRCWLATQEGGGRVCAIVTSHCKAMLESTLLESSRVYDPLA